MICQQCNQLFLELDLQPPQAFCAHCVEAAGKCHKCDCALFGIDTHDVEVDDKQQTVKFCDDCYNDTFVDCEHCGETIEISDATDVDDDYYCDDCLDNRFTRCSDCDEYIHNNRLYEVNGDYYCSSCYSDNWYVCSECDIFVRAGECCNCENSDDDDGIREHSYKPHTKFFGKDTSPKLFFGFELEVENACDQISNSEAAGDLQDSLSEVYCKKDSSVANGFEIVSHPLSFGYLRELDLSPIFNLAKNGFKSYNTSTCGMHVHLSAKAFTTLHLYKFMKFFYDNPSFIYKISQRKSRNEMERWASVETDGESIAHKAKCKENGNGHRYCAINLRNTSTVEVRIFKGTLKESSFRKNIEFCHALYCFTKNVGIASITLDKFYAYVHENHKQYANLQAFIVKGA